MIRRRPSAGSGLTRMNKSVVVDDTPSFRGMIKKVLHLVTSRRWTRSSGANDHGNDAAHAQAEPGGDQAQEAPRPRRRLRPRQDRRPGPEGPERPRHHGSKPASKAARRRSRAACRSAASPTPLQKDMVAVNVGELERSTPGEGRRARAQARRPGEGQRRRIKILGDGELTKKLTVHAHSFSERPRRRSKRRAARPIAVPHALRRPRPPVRVSELSNVASPASRTSARSRSSGGACSSRSGCSRSTASASSSPPRASTAT